MGTSHLCSPEGDGGGCAVVKNVEPVNRSINHLSYLYLIDKRFLWGRGKNAHFYSLYFMYFFEIPIDGFSENQSFTFCFVNNFGKVRYHFLKNNDFTHFCEQA